MGRLDFKEYACNARDKGDAGSIPGSGRSPGVGNGNALQYSMAGNFMDRGAWQLQSMGLQTVRYDLATQQQPRTYVPAVKSLGREKSLNFILNAVGNPQCF